MTDPVVLPFWLLLLILGFAAVTFASHFLFPSVRWFLRGRMERAVTQLNQRLTRPIEPFKLMARNDKIVRLTFDPDVLEAVAARAAETGRPGTVVIEEARDYAREIVPGFSTLVYFGFAIRAARWLSKLLYRVRVGRVDAALEGIDPGATVVFVMNHRSNMDYVLVTWLVADRSPLSYAVGEWARVWPISWLFRAMGAYFIRRGSHNGLYRRVLARWVQMATAEGTTQAIFPEGGLSLDGRVGRPRVGLLSYIQQGAVDYGRPVVFVPVGIGYDRVVEDRLLVEAGLKGERRFRAGPFAMLAFLVRHGWRMLRGRFPGFGTAAVVFGPPVALEGDITPEALGARLMTEVMRAVPVLPVPLVAAAIGESGIARADLPHQVAALARDLDALGAELVLPTGGLPTACEDGLRALLKRDVLTERDGILTAAPNKEALLAFYGAAVVQRLEAGREEGHLTGPGFHSIT